jgi:putative transposase
MKRGYPVTKVLRIVGVARSTYYYQTCYAVAEKQVSEGRPIPGYSYDRQGIRIPDEQIKEWLMELISGPRLCLWLS